MCEVFIVMSERLPVVVVLQSHVYTVSLFLDNCVLGTISRNFTNSGPVDCTVSQFLFQIPHLTLQSIP